MNLYNSNTKNSTIAIRAICAIAFCVFSFTYLFFFQADLLAMAQHSLSKGVTHYDRTIGAILITFSLQLLQIGVSAIIKPHCRIYAFTYFPSLLILATVTNISALIDAGSSLWILLWDMILFLILWGTIVFISQQFALKMINPSRVYLQVIWNNVMIMSLSFLAAGVIGNADSVFHYRLRIETYLQKHDFSGALGVGRNSLETDCTLTMLRMYALARENRLGDELFTYPVKGTSADIVPTDGGTRCMIYPADSIYRTLGARPLKGMNVVSYLKALTRSGQATRCVRDYILCSYLIDKKIDLFVRELPFFYDVNDSLPKHYREALILYTHLRSNPQIVYHNNVMDTDFEDLQALEMKHPSFLARKRAVFGQYSGTYWWYYEYE